MAAKNVFRLGRIAYAAFENFRGGAVAILGHFLDDLRPLYVGHLGAEQIAQVLAGVLDQRQDFLFVGFGVGNGGRGVGARGFSEPRW